MTKSKTPVYYAGAPDTCDMCNKPFGTTMYDAAIPRSSWANMCPECFKDNNCALGLGRGQKYMRTVDRRWLKVKG